MNPRMLVNRTGIGRRSCLAALLGLSAAAAFREGWAAESPGPTRGIAFLPSSLGKDVPTAEALAFVRACKLDWVVLDLGWITFHWPRTDVTAVEELSRKLKDAGIAVTAMYRPRVLYPQEAAIHYAVDGNGGVAKSHNDLCYAHEDSVAWGASWGEKIVAGLPSVEEILLYNLRSPCACPQCRGGQSQEHVAAFLRRCRADWRRTRPTLRIGHVGVGDEYAKEVDFLCPFFEVNRRGGAPAEFARSAAVVSRLKSAHPGRRVVPLLKTDWARDTNNDTSDVVRALETCQRERHGFLLWYYDHLFYAEDGRYDRQALVGALGGDWSQLRELYAPQADAPAGETTKRKGGDS